MKKRFIVQRIVTTTKDWLGQPLVPPTERVLYLCKPSLAPKLWTDAPKEVWLFSKEEGAEKAAFTVVVSNIGEYVGEVSVHKVPGQRDQLKVRRRGVPRNERNYGRWPHSSGRRKK